MNNLSIGIYGDSYADGRWSKGGDRFTAWPREIIHLFGCQGQVYGRSGTSTYYSFEKFLDTYHNHNVIIFSYSSPIRWPHLPEEMAECSYNYHTTKGTPFTQLDEMNKFFFDVFNERLLCFLDESIVRTVNRICEENEKYLINVFPFGDGYYKLPRTKFPIYTELNKISWEEKLYKNGKMFNMFDLHTKENERDHRICHLSSANNMFIAKTFQQAIENQTLNEFHNLYEERQWIEYDELAQEMYKIPR